MHSIALNAMENKHLAAIRDALLPKLMSGEIDVSKVDISDPSYLDKLLFSEVFKKDANGRFFIAYISKYIICTFDKNLGIIIYR